MSDRLTGVAPSILAADFARLGAQVEEVIEAGATVIHVDVMDGHFVPPISMGAYVVSALKPLCSDRGALLDVHLMVERPERHVADYAKAGADVITVHAEATPHLHYALQAVRAAGCRAGAALCPGTPVEALSEVAGDLDLALCMTVNPGWGGQPFIPTSPDKIRRLRDLVGPDVAVEVDGGVDARTAGACAEAGASVLVAGSAVFSAPRS
jgi:ribulose-phosphate 3-epimerase